MTAGAMADTPRPVPPRYRWLARGTAAVVVTAGVLLGLRVWWGHAADRRLADAVAAARGRGEPALVDDFADPTPAPGNGDAADLFRRAMGGVALNPAQQAWDDTWDPHAPLTAADRSMLDGMVAANAGPLDLARRAVDQPGANWGVRLTSPVYAVAFPLANGERGLANLLWQAAAAAHAGGDDATAVADLRAVVRLADAMTTSPPFLVNHLVAIGINAAGCGAVQRSAGELNVGRDGPARAAAEGLLRQLCDESAYAAGGRRQAFGERLFQVDVAGDPLAGLSGLGVQAAPPARWLAWAVRPAVTASTARAFADATAVAAAYGAATLPAAVAAVPPPPGNSGTPLDNVGSFLQRLGAVNSTRPLASHFRGLTDRRAAAVLLALRLYAADHGDRLPATLADLVPAYLPAVPVDPMSTGGQPLRYLPARAVVYSVGIDGVDDGGSTVLVRRVAAGSTPSPWDFKDAVFALRPAGAATRPASGDGASPTR